MRKRGIAATPTLATLKACRARSVYVGYGARFWRKVVGSLASIGLFIGSGVVGRRVVYHERSVEGKKRESRRKPIFQRMVRMLVLSKFVRLWR